MNEYNEIIKKIISDTLDFLGVDYKININKDDELKILIFNIETTDSRLLIGSGGDNLNALQLIVKMMAAKKIGDNFYSPFSIDVNNYQQERIYFIRENAKNVADEVELTKKPVTLRPMSSFERRIIHLDIMNRGGAIITESVGYGPDRRIIIRPI